MIISREFTMTDSILQELLRLERLDISRRQRIGEKKASGKTTSSYFSRASTSETSTAGIKKDTTKEKDGSSTWRPSSAKGSMQCYNCKSIGHYAKNCPSPRREIKCFLCKQIGHIASRCMNVKKEPERNASSEVNKLQNNVNTVSSEVMEKELDKFIREIQLGEVRLCVQIDSDASVCTIRASVVLNENLPVTQIKSVLGGFGNSQVISPGIVTQVVILDNLKPREVDFRVVPDTAQKYDEMLGRPFTEALDIS